jgi:hypothetical protein
VKGINPEMVVFRKLSAPGLVDGDDEYTNFPPLSGSAGNKRWCNSYRKIIPLGSAGLSQVTIKLFPPGKATTSGAG